MATAYFLPSGLSCQIAIEAQYVQKQQALVKHGTAKHGRKWFRLGLDKRYHDAVMLVYAVGCLGTCMCVQVYVVCQRTKIWGKQEPTNKQNK